MPDDLSEWARRKPVHDAVLAEARHGREWPFSVGDQVTARGNWGPAVGDLRAYTDRNFGAVLTVHAAKNGGQWLSLRDEDGRVYDAGEFGPCYGPGYFRIAGECGDHFPGYRNLEWRTRQDGGEYVCFRCDEPMPDITRALLGEEKTNG